MFKWHVGVERIKEFIRRESLSLMLNVFKIQTSFHLVVNNFDCIDEIKNKKKEP